MRIVNFFSFILLISFLSAACGGEGNAPKNALQNVQPSPTVSAVVNSPAANEQPGTNAANAASVNANQTVKPTPTVSPTPKATASPEKTANENSNAKTKYKNYTVRGVVKGIDAAKSSITIDHEDIGDYMVAMEMPFPVVNKKSLEGLKVGDKITFVLETGVGVERIISIRKN